MMHGCPAPVMLSTYTVPSLVFFPLALGARSVFFTGEFESELGLETWLRAVHKHSATVMVSNPLNLEKIATRSAPDATLPPTLRAISSSGAPLPLTVHRAFVEKFGDIIVEGIGASEYAHIFVSNRPGQVKMGSAGRMVDGVGYKLIGSDGAVVGIDEPGTLWVKGQAARGYFDDADLSRKIFQDGWLNTQDVYRVDSDGFFFFQGRPGDLMKMCGKLVSPLDIENLLRTHPRVHDCLLVLRQQPPPGMLVPQPCAFVVLKGEKSSDLANETMLRNELREHVSSQIEPWKAPAYFEFIEEIPRTNGKPLRSALAAA